MFDSVRTRLTIAIALLAAVSSAAAVFFGTQFVEADLVDTALDDAIDFYVDEDGRFLPFGGGVEDFADPVGVASIDGAGLGPSTTVLPPVDSLAIPSELFILSEMMAEAESLDSDEAALFQDLIEFEDYFQDYGAAYLEATVERLDRLGFTPRLMSIMSRTIDQPIDVAFVGPGSSVFEINPFDPSGDVGAFGFAVLRYDPATATIDRTERLPGSTLILPGEEVEKLNDLLPERAGARGVEAPVDIRFREVATNEGYTIGAFADVSERTRSVDEMRSSLWFAAAVLTALATLATWLLTGRALRPVAAITQRVGDISTGNLDERVPVPETKDEVNELATTMNGMLDRIESGDRKRRQFVSDASHELRTPVAVLKSEAEVALRTPESTDVSVLAAAVLDESDRMGSMVEDLLTLARSDELVAPAPELPEAAARPVVDLDELVLADINRNRSLPIDRSEVSAGRVHGSRDELSRVVTHLLDNAARHGRSQVAVGVRESLDHSMVELWVDDDGDGVAVADSERIFERFVRLDEARNRDGGGAGLGLAVVRSTVRKLGGTVQVLVSPLGGARFLVRLPVARGTQENSHPQL